METKTETKPVETKTETKPVETKTETKPPIEIKPGEIKRKGRETPTPK